LRTTRCFNPAAAVRAALAASVLLLAATPWASAQAADWRLRVGVGRVDFREDVSLAVAGNTVPGASATLSDANTLLAEIGYRFTPAWSLGLTLGVPPITDVDGSGAAAPFGRLGDVRYGPIALTGQYQFNAGGTVRPYVGAGTVYFMVVDESDGAIAGLEAKSRFGSLLHVGADIALTPTLGAYIDVKKLFVKTRATGTLPALGGAPVEARVRLDPVVFSAGLSFDF
jgi:outer membrane protein